MKKNIITFLFILIFIAVSSTAQAEIYQWVDNNGVMHVANHLDNVPPAYRNKVEVKSSPRIAEEANERIEEYYIPFEKAPSGVMFVQVFINNVIRAKMIVDTGASLVLISGELAKKIDQTASSERDKIKLKTAGGVVEGRSVLIQKIELGNAVRENVRAAVNYQKEVFDDFDGLLGLSFLDDFKVTIDHQNREIILRRQ